MGWTAKTWFRYSCSVHLSKQHSQESIFDLLPINISICILAVICILLVVLFSHSIIWYNLIHLLLRFLIIITVFKNKSSCAVMFNKRRINYEKYMLGTRPYIPHSFFWNFHHLHSLIISAFLWRFNRFKSSINYLRFPKRKLI